MRIRRTARVLLIDPDRRLLLMKARDFADPEAGPPFWATIGGGCEDGESIEACAAREIVEESGIEGARLGPIVWYGEFVLPVDPPLLFQEHFIVAHAPHARLSRAGWTQLERDMVLDMRWFTLAQVQALRERHYPSELAALLPPILAGDYPSSVIQLERNG
jgi:8-oxo-dGTP pyrophosphatase MutT (NUDIX family)